VALAVSVLALLAGAPTTASAHVRSTEGTSRIVQDGSTVRYTLSLEYDLLTAAAGLGTPDPAGGEEGRGELLRQQRGRLEAYLTERVTVSLDGVRCPGRLARAEVGDNQGKASARLLLVHDCPGSSSGAYAVRYGVFSESDAVVDDHINIADYRLGGATGTYVFDAGHHEFEAGRTAGPMALGRFVVMGVEHILGGLDHVLFLAVLLLGARGIRSVVRLVTAFTAAHSLTLGFGALGWVEVPAQIVEPLIALSIVYVAAENILGGESRHRLLVVFGFGLLHGLGFAEALSFTDGLGSRLLGSLLSFNLGVELGQLLVIAVLFPLLLVVRRFAWSRQVHTGAGALAGGLGLLWFFQRFLLA
jgi:hypothetical protein